ncbi:pilus assembly protein [Azotobacter chroococcum subsp. isscasi]|uniref:TadE/TadG family type IV pilus assembly protein n=1 Tax=Azotobacter chroococcum TaxID=353 RepID=UPI00103F657B|nr:TadE/TadG family type IV pilus assembly protein [Azotobacter chroococcum]TBW09597.1 pilus assembly protein [Azotobacter chroococcum subsp. isscasi]
MKRQGFKLARGQSGLAMVEFAIALPLLLLMLLAVAEFGRMLYHYNNLMQASRDASRYVAGQAWNSTLGEVELTDALLTQTRNIAVYGLPVSSGTTAVPGLTADQVSVIVEPGTIDHVRVSISYAFQPVIGASIPAFIREPISLGVTLVATTVMRVL